MPFPLFPGGNVHTHYQEEKCYEDGIFFYHLGCHQWVSGAELAPPGTPEGRAAPPSGRYSHVAAVLGGSVLLVAGGYSGRPRGDLMAYKVPPFVFQAPALDYHLDYCSMYTDHSVCSRDPECSWCQGACQAAPPPGTPSGACPAASCLGLGRLLSDCQACLAFSSPTAPPRGPGALGWFVHNESCLPRPGLHCPKYNYHLDTQPGDRCVPSLPRLHPPPAARRTRRPWG